MVNEISLTLNSPRASGKKKQTLGPVCIIHYQQNKTDCKVRELSESIFNKIKEADEVRKAQGSENERLSDVYDVYDVYESYRKIKKAVEVRKAQDSENERLSDVCCQVST